MSGKIIKIEFQKSLKTCLFALIVCLGTAGLPAQENLKTGGGYAVTKQIKQNGYTCEIYNALNGLPTSDANFILGSSDGYVWICGYSGVIRYDGSVFERLPTDSGLTSGRVLFEDSRHRIWVGTNDNGVVVIDGEKKRNYTFREGLPSSSIRSFAEDSTGNIFIGTTSGLAYVDTKDKLNVLSEPRLNSERVLKLEADSNGKIYGQTKNGIVFAIVRCNVSEVYTSTDLGFEKITTILVDPENAGMVYYGTEDIHVYYGSFGQNVSELRRINVYPLENIHWLSYDCGRVWVSSSTLAGYIDEKWHFHKLNNIPMDSTIEMTTSDYQGNIWAASSTQGVMKLVANNFVDLSEIAGLEKETVNTTCIHNDLIYIGTDNGLQILTTKNKPVENELTEYIGKARVRCIIADKNDNIWLATYTNNLGVVCQNKNGKITSYTKNEGLINNQVRCLCAASDGRILAGTSGGLAVIKDGAVVNTYGSEQGIKNTEFLTVTEGDNGDVYCGSDGDGIYIIGKDGISKIGRSEGLSSDVVMRIKKDESRGIYWIITSNSIEYLKNGMLKTISSFPYNNNYDLYLNDKNEVWVLSSYGIYTVNVENLYYDYVKDYRVYTIANGLPYSITGNSFSSYDSSGNLYIAGREGVICVNMNHYIDSLLPAKIALKSIYCDNQKISANQDGSYTLPPSKGRIKLSVSILDYSLDNPYVKVYLEGSGDHGITVKRNELSSLEYTGLAYGNYTLHVQILDNNKKDVITEKSFSITKKPGIWELIFIRVLFVIIVVIAAGFIVWRFMKSTIIRHQYSEIQLAKEEAERANTAKSRFLSNMSQEILTPINTIMGMNEMIMREDFTNVPKGYFISMMNYAFGIRGASQTLLSLVTDLLEMTKIESGALELVQVEYDVSKMLRSIIEPVQARISEKGLKFDIKIDEMIPKRLYGDLGKIRQVMLKLLSNAEKYTDHGSLELNLFLVSRNDDECKLCFTVKDTGIGIKPEEIEKLFGTDEDQYNIGLNISKNFAKLLGGELVCTSVYGEGAKFIFTLNQKIVDASPIGVFNEHDDGAGVRGPYIPQFIAPDADILVADANEMNLDIIKKLLKATKVFVTTATTAEDCLENTRKSFFNIVFINQMLIKDSEKEYIEKIRDKNPELPVYIITENTFKGERDYKAMGYNGCLYTPIDSMLLERTIMRNLPESMMQQPPAGYFSEELTEFPPSLAWLKQVEGISVDEGLKNSDGISGYIRGVKLFYDTIDDNSQSIDKAYTKGDTELYMAKIQMIKTSAQIVGATRLLELACKLEDACKKDDRIYIASHTDELLKIYNSFKEKLSGLYENQKPETTFGEA